MENPLNDTQNSPETQNPQESVANPGASNSSDFQAPATDEVLRQEAKDSVAVESTGQPIAGGSTAVAKSDNTAYFWVLGGVLVVVVGVVLIMKQLRQEEKAYTKAPAAPAAAKKKPAVKKPVKKAPAKPTKKKPGSAKRRKSAKRR